MISPEERRRLMERLGSDSAGPLRVVLKCAACLVVLAIIAAGPWVFLSSGGPTAAKGGHPAAKVDATQAKSRRVFEERRRRLEAVPAGDVEKAGDAQSQQVATE